MIIAASLFYLSILALAFCIACVRWPALTLASLFAYSAITKSVSVFYIEQGRWFLSETGIASSNIGASWRNILYNVVIFGFAIIMQFRSKKLSDRQVQPVNADRIGTALTICAIALAAQTINVMTSGMAFSPERHALWQNVKLPVLRDFLGVLIAFVPFVASTCAVYAWRRGYRPQALTACAVLAAYFIYLIASGQGFNGLLTGVLLAGTPILSLLLVHRIKIPTKRLALLALVGLTIFISASLGNLSQRGIRQFSDGSALGTLAYRAFVLQGGVYYTSDYRTKNGAGDVNPSILLNGMEETIRTLTPGKLAEVYIRKGVNLAGSLPGNTILAFGYWGAIPFLALYGIVLGAQCRLTHKLIIEGRIFALFPASYIMIWISSIYARGSFEPLTDPKLYVFLAIICLSLGYKRSTPAILVSAVAKTNRN